jgi:hypothetical protein
VGEMSGRTEGGAVPPTFVILGLDPRIHAVTFAEGAQRSRILQPLQHLSVTEWILGV